MDEPAEARQESVGDYPKELVEFLAAGPRTLVVRGRPRSGKTLFALGLAETRASPQNTFIVNTRAFEPQVYETFPWLKNNEARDKSLEVLSQVSAPAHKAPPKPVKPPEEEARIKSAREMLRGILGEVPEAPPPEEPQKPERPPEGPDISGLKAALGENRPRELVRIFRGLERVPEGVGPVVVILDRADRFCEKNGIDLAKLAGAMGADLSKRYQAHLLLVLEKPGGELDKLADGIVSLKEVGQSDDFLGQLELVKLGELKIKSPKWMYNLRAGRFQVLKGMRVWG